jgi:hypothetical protein
MTKKPKRVPLEKLQIQVEAADSQCVLTHVFNNPPFPYTRHSNEHISQLVAASAPPRERRAVRGGGDATVRDPRRGGGFRL